MEQQDEQSPSSEEHQETPPAPQVPEVPEEPKTVEGLEEVKGDESCYECKQVQEQMFKCPECKEKSYCMVCVRKLIPDDVYKQHPPVFETEHTCWCKHVMTISFKKNQMPPTKEQKELIATPVRDPEEEVKEGEEGTLNEEVKPAESECTESMISGTESTISNEIVKVNYYTNRNKVLMGVVVVFMVLVFAAIVFNNGEDTAPVLSPHYTHNHKTHSVKDCPYHPHNQGPPKVVIKQGDPEIVYKDKIVEQEKVVEKIVYKDREKIILKKIPVYPGPVKIIKDCSELPMVQEPQKDLFSLLNQKTKITTKKTFVRARKVYYNPGSTKPTRKVEVEAEVNTATINVKLTTPSGQAGMLENAEQGTVIGLNTPTGPGDTGALLDVKMNAPPIRHKIYGTVKMEEGEEGHKPRYNPHADPLKELE